MIGLNSEHQASSNHMILGPSRRFLSRRGRNRSGDFLEKLIQVSEPPIFGKKTAIPSGPLYTWLQANLPTFFRAIGQQRSGHTGLIAEHSEKCSPFRDRWEKEGIPYFHAVAIYLLSYTYPYNTQVRETENGWTDVDSWVIGNYSKFKTFLPPA